MITIPKQFYVGRREQHKNENPLAFLTPYDDHTTKMFEKRKGTVDRWASGHYWEKKKELEAIILDNTPQEGFEIAKEVRRHGWNGGNVVWRMIDPRGFEFEISSANLARILDCATVENGVIKGKCVFGRDKAQNVLLPENSEPYKEAFANTERAKKKVSIKDVKPGDRVVLKDGREGVYLGLYSVAYVTNKTSFTRTSFSVITCQTYKLADIKRRHFFRETVTEELKDKLSLYHKEVGDYVYTAISDPHVSQITESTEQPLDTAKIAEEINVTLQDAEQRRWDILHNAYFISDKPVKQLTLKEVPSSKKEFLSLENGKRPFAVVRLNGANIPLRIQAREYPVDSNRYYVSTISDGIKEDGTVTYAHGTGMIDEKTADAAVWTKVVAEYEGKQYEIRTY